MKLTIYVLKEKVINYDQDTHWSNIKSTTYWHEARGWKDSSTSNTFYAIKRGFDTMQVEIPDSVVWSK